MNNLLSITERLKNPKVSKLEKLVRIEFIDVVKNLNINKVLSISCGDGTWEYLVFHHAKSIKEIIATDIVECPVSKSDQLLLKDLGNWSFTKVDASGILPFEDNHFDFVFHQDVVEHTDKPYTFLKEQYRVLRGGGHYYVALPIYFALLI